MKKVVLTDEEWSIVLELLGRGIEETSICNEEMEAERQKDLAVQDAIKTQLSE